MTKAAFNKIAEGLKDAVAHARGEKPARYECGHWHISFEDALLCPEARKSAPPSSNTKGTGEESA